MTFRYARHTTDLKRIEAFYTTIVGLQKLGAFKDHDGYDGIFLGLPGLDWHLEFTVSGNKPARVFDEEDILVFYLHSKIEINATRETLKNSGIETEIPKNPYWQKNGMMISDPDGYKIIFSYKNRPLTAKDNLTQQVLNLNIGNWGDLLSFIQQLPYGRNQNREDLSLVLSEGKGTCSSKHAFLKKIAMLNNIEQVKLLVGIYRMNKKNTPKIENTIAEHGLEYIPEAHCYLLLNNRRIDITSPLSNIDVLINDVIEEIEIEAEQVNEFKVEYHKNFLRNWIERESINKSFEEIWVIRERCIEKLGE